MAVSVVAGGLLYGSHGWGWWGLGRLGGGCGETEGLKNSPAALVVPLPRRSNQQDGKLHLARTQVTRTMGKWFGHPKMGGVMQKFSTGPIRRPHT